MHQTGQELESVFAAFDEIVITLPSNTTLEVKAYLIDFILKAVAEGKTTKMKLSRGL